MKLSKLRNAIVYRATLPGIEAVEGHLHELPTLSWVKQSLHGRLLYLTQSPANWLRPSLAVMQSWSPR